MIQFDSITLREDRRWAFAWTDTGAAYYRIVLNGVEVDRIETNAYVYDGYSPYPPALEVMEEDEIATSEKNSPYFTMQWHDVTNVSNYVISEQIGAAWKQQTVLIDSPSIWVYTVQTPKLNDETLYTFKLESADSIGQRSDPQIYQIFVVRPPDPPNGAIAVDYDEDSQSIVISEV